MKTLKYFLTEREMDRDKALKIMGLPSGYTLDQLKTRRKELAKKFHTDTGGGSHTQMADVNAAYDSLDKASGGSRTTGGRSYEMRRPSDEDRRDAITRDKAYFEVALQQFEDRVASDTFTKHFEKVFSDKFTFTYHTPRYSDSRYVSWNDNLQQFTCDKNYFTAKLEWANAGRTTVVVLWVNVSYTDLADQRLFSSHNLDMSLSIHYEIMHNQRKVKIAAKSYNWKADPTILTNPELLFPAKKLATKKVADKARKFSRRDFEATITHELRARISANGKDTWAYIPVGDWSICMYRNTFMGLGTWAFSGITHHNGGSNGGERIGGYKSIFETEGALKWLVDHIKKIQSQHQHSNPKQIAAAVEAIQNDWENVKDKFGDEWEALGGGKRKYY